MCALVLLLGCVGFIGVQNKNGTAKAESTSTSVTMDWRGAYTEGNTLDYCYIGFAGFTAKDDYNGNANNDYVFQNILINGKALCEINNTTDTTGWLWEVFPSTAGEQYEKPVLGYIKDKSGRIQLRIHRNLSNALLVQDGHLRFTVKKPFAWLFWGIFEQKNVVLPTEKMRSFQEILS